MKNAMKKMFMFTSVVGAAALLTGCMSCPNKHPKHMQKRYVQPVELVESDTVVVYQTYENADVNKVYAKMYTHSSAGGQSRMGHIKFHEIENGLKMTVDLKDMRPGVPYNVRLYQCAGCGNDSACCNRLAMDKQMPMLETGTSRKLHQTYMIHGMTAAQLDGATIYLERDGGYKAAWGKLEK